MTSCDQHNSAASRLSRTQFSLSVWVGERLILSPPLLIIITQDNRSQLGIQKLEAFFL